MKNFIKKNLPPKVKHILAQQLASLSKPKPRYPDLIPPQELNWNFHGNSKNYEILFNQNFLDYCFPQFLIEHEKRFGQIQPIQFLDIGCGWGPMATAFVNYSLSIDADSKSKVHYTGVDIREDCLNWLKSAYKEHASVSFEHHQTETTHDYVDAELFSKAGTASESTGSEANYSFELAQPHNTQWTSSVFTHLTPQASLEMLKYIKKTASAESLQFNTWILIDEVSRYSLKSGAADRSLPYDLGPYLTSSQENPLMCTAYKIDHVREMYRNAGLKILEIAFGSWRGPAFKNRFNHYQDVIISTSL